MANLDSITDDLEKRDAALAALENAAADGSDKAPNKTERKTNPAIGDVIKNLLNEIKKGTKDRS